MWSARRNVELDSSDLDIQPVQMINTGHFYRVQHLASATLYRPPPNSTAFEAKSVFNRRVDLSHERIMRHLDWSDHTEPGTSFVSVFDNYYDALVRALHFYDKGYHQIAIFVIHASGLVKKQIQHDGTPLSVWSNSFTGSSGTEAWFQMKEIGPVFNICPRRVQKSEWLACSSIPKERVFTVFPLIGNRLYFSRIKSLQLDDHLNEMRGDTGFKMAPDARNGRFEFHFKKQMWIARNGRTRTGRTRRPQEEEKLSFKKVYPGSVFLDAPPPVVIAFSGVCILVDGSSPE